MKQLVHDAGIDQYSTVRKAYDRAKEILADEPKRRAELPGLLAILEENNEGVEWLRLEEDSFEANYDMFRHHLMEDKRRIKEQKAARAVAKKTSLEKSLLSIDPGDIAAEYISLKSDKLSFKEFNGSHINKGVIESVMSRCEYAGYLLAKKVK